MPDRKPDDEADAVPATLPAELIPLVEAFAEHLADNPKLSAHTRRGYPSRLRGYLAWLDSAVLDGMDGDALVSPKAAEYAVGEYRRWMLTTGRRTPNTANSHMTAIAAFYASHGIAVATDRIDVVPVRRALELDERRRLDAWLATTTAISERDKAILRTFRYTGVRLEELTKLNTDDIPMTARAGTVKVRYGKGGKPRDVPMAPLLRFGLADYRAHRLADAEPGALFLSRLGKRLSVDAAADVVTAAGKAVGIDPLTPHRLRHSFGTQLREHGVDPMVTELLLGHGLGSLGQRYTMPGFEELAAAVATAFALPGRRAAASAEPDVGVPGQLDIPLPTVNLGAGPRRTGKKLEDELGGHRPVRARIRRPESPPTEVAARERPQSRPGAGAAESMGMIGSYLACATLADLALPTADDPGDYDVAGLTDAVRDALNAGLAGTGVSLAGDGVSSSNPAHEDSDEVETLIKAAFATIDLDGLRARYRAAAAPVADVITLVPARTKAPSSAAGRRRHLVALDVDSVRLVHSTDETRPGWRVVAGPVDDPVEVGFLERVFTGTGSRGGWTGVTASSLAVPGVWTSRAEALVHLVDAYQQAAKRS